MHVGNTLNRIEDPDLMEKQQKISSHITEMPKEIQERFKAIKVLADECSELDEDLESQMHQLVIVFE